MELASAKVRVNAVSPAVVETAIYEAFIPPGPQVHKAHLGSPAPFGMSMAAVHFKTARGLGYKFVH